MFPWVVVMKQGCIIVTKAVAFVSFNYRLSALMKYLPLLKCTQSVERHSLMDLAKLCYKRCLKQTLARYS